MKLLHLLIERIGDEPEPIIKYQIVIEALQFVIANEMDKIRRMPDDQLKDYARNMMKAISKDLQTTIKRTY